MSDDQVTPETAPDAQAAPGDVPAAGVGKVQVIGCPAATRDRLLASLGATEESPPDVIVVSTRASVRDLPDAPTVPVVALVHPGGTAQARRFLEAGVHGCVPEGREELVAAVVGAEAEAPLTGTLRALLDAPPPADELPEDVERVVAATEAPDARCLVVEVPALADLTAQLGTGVSALVRVRIERVLASLVPGVASAPFGDARYVLAAPGTGPTDVGALSGALAGAVGLLRDLDGAAITSHVGHAGVDDAADPRIRLDLAAAACDLAVLESRHDASVADVLERRSLPQAAQVLLDLADTADDRAPERAPSRLVAEVAAGIAEALEWDHEEIDVARLAGRLHAVGGVGAGDADDEARLAYLRARLVGVDPRVLDAIAHHGEPHDAEAATPGEAARVLAVALTTAQALHDGRPVGATLAEAAGLDPAMVTMATDRFAVPEPELATG